MSAENEHSENGGAVATSSERLVDLYTQMHRIDPWFLTDEKEASFFWAKPDEDLT